MANILLVRFSPTMWWLAWSSDPMDERRALSFSATRVGHSPSKCCEDRLISTSPAHCQVSMHLCAFTHVDIQMWIYAYGPHLHVTLISRQIEAPLTRSRLHIHVRMHTQVHRQNRIFHWVSQKKLSSLWNKRRERWTKPPICIVCFSVTSASSGYPPPDHLSRLLQTAKGLYPALVAHNWDWTARCVNVLNACCRILGVYSVLSECQSGKWHGRWSHTTHPHTCTRWNMHNHTYMYRCKVSVLPSSSNSRSKTQAIAPFTISLSPSATTTKSTR